MSRNAKRALMICGGVLLVIVGFYGWLVMRYAVPPPKPSRNFSEALNEPVLKRNAGLPWQRYRETLLAVNADAPRIWIDDSQAVIAAIEHNEEASGAVAPTAAEIRTATEFVRRHDLRIRNLRSTAEFQWLGVTLSETWPKADRELVFRHVAPPKREQLIAAEAERAPQRNPPLWSMRYPRGEIVEVAQVLHAHAALAARHGDGESVAGDVKALFNLARQVREIPELLQDQLSAQIARQATVAWSNALYRNPTMFMRDDLRELEQSARSVAEKSLTISIDSQRNWLLDMLQRNYTGAEDGYAYVPELIGGRLEKSADDIVPEIPVATRMRWASRREILDRYDRLLALAGPAMAKPFWERDWTAYDFERNQLRDDPRYWPAHEFSVDAEQYHAQREEALQLLDATILVSAATRYRLETGDWPGSAQELVTLYLPQLPPDRFTGKPLGYRYDRHRPVIYSIGADGKDDAGRAAIVTSYDSKESVSQPWHGEFHSRIMRPDGDLILWPIAAPKVQVITTKK